MADLRITQLPPLSGADLAATDVVALADVSASETKKLTSKELVQNGILLTDNGSIPGAKLVADSVTAAQLAPDSVTASELANSAVDTAAIADLAVTNSKIAPGVDGAKITNDTIAAAKIVATSLDRGLDKTTGRIGHTNSVVPGSAGGVSYDAHGHVTGASPLAPADLPIATTTAIGGVSIPVDSGLSVSGTGAVNHGNTITPGIRSGITYNATGHITGTAALVGSDLPTATNTTKGAVSVPGPALSVTGAGALTHLDSGVGAGTYTKVTVNGQGHVTSGTTLAASDIPSLDANKINTGVLDAARIADRTLTNLKFADYATTLIQEGQPTGTDFYTGQFWYRESDAQLRTWSGNSWIPVGFGRLSEENLRFCGTFNATTGSVVQVTPFGSTAGLSAGGAIPGATDQLTGVYLVCATAGTYAGNVYDQGDWVLCLGQAQGWVRIDTLSGGGGTTLNLGDLLDVTITAPSSGDSLIFDSSTNTWKNRTTHGVKLSLVEPFDGSRTSFTASGVIVAQTNLLVSIGGIIQEPGIDFSAVAGSTTLSFTTAPPAGSNYWILQEASIDGGGGGGGGTTLPPGTAANEYLQWNSATSSWLPSDTLNGGNY